VGAQAAALLSVQTSALAPNSSAVTTTTSITAAPSASGAAGPASADEFAQLDDVFASVAVQAVAPAPVVAHSGTAGGYAVGKRIRGLQFDSHFLGVAGVLSVNGSSGGATEVDEWSGDVCVHAGA
jgi:hypothetical protein